ncbi:MAG: aldose epimerase family protein, partial [Oscillospiraceae bacterium]|nr:aldose epimerase family protein [Oscillospiraceae bacterium]
MAARELYGELDGKEVFKYTLRAGDYEAEFCEYGCRVLSFSHIKNGRRLDIALGYDDFKSYLEPCGNMGAVCGRFANRIAGGRFELDGREYRLAVNNGPNHLHGGIKGFDKRLWRGAARGESVIMDYVSEDGEEGYPGTLAVSVCYSLSTEGELAIEYTAETDRPTPINLTNHSYFNLSGDFSQDIGGHLAEVSAESYLVSDADCLPTGELRPVAGTVFDLRSGALLGDILSSGDTEVGGARGRPPRAPRPTRGPHGALTTPTLSMISCHTPS